MHPGINDLSEFTDTQIEEKLNKCQRYYFITDNPEVRQQLILVMDTYKIELETRRQAAKKQELENSDDNGLDSLINVS
jgi:predicted transcriptional regulator of viral defense system